MSRVSLLTTYRPAAVICRENGWKAGTHLIGDEGFGPTVILITAVGEETILARRISENGKPVSGYESTWTLSCRNWREVSDPPAKSNKEA